MPEIHPLGRVVTSVLEDGPDGAVVLSDQGLEYVRRALDAYLDEGEALMAAVDTLLVAAHIIEVDQGSRDVAVRLVALVDRPEVLAALRQITQATEARRAREVARSAERFSAFRGDATSAVGPAPAAGAARRPAGAPKAVQPEGAVRLGDLAFPRRL